MRSNARAASTSGQKSAHGCSAPCRKAREVESGVSISIARLVGFRHTPIVPRTSEAEALHARGPGSIQNLSLDLSLGRLPPRAIFDDKNRQGQISPKKGQPRPAAAMDDYSDIDVIL